MLSPAHKPCFNLFSCLSLPRTAYTNPCPALCVFASPPNATVGLTRLCRRYHSPFRPRTAHCPPPPHPGDLNDFAGSSALGVLYASGLTNAYLLPEQSGLLRTPPNQRYSYNFEGNAQVRLVWPPILRLCYQLAPPCNHPPLPPHAPSLVLQALDHILLSPSLVGGAEVGVLHVNSEFADDAASGTRFSDHDPLMVRVAGASAPTRLPPPPTASVHLPKESRI